MADLLDALGYFRRPEDAQTADTAYEAPEFWASKLKNYQTRLAATDPWKSAEGSPWKPEAPPQMKNRAGVPIPSAGEQIRSAFTSEPVQSALNIANFIGPGPKAPLPGVTQAIKAASALPNKDALLTTHNLTGANLEFAAKHFDGKLPVPSIGITKMEQPLDGFGEVTLVGSPNLAKPSSSNPVFMADAYTSRFPDLRMKLDRASQKSMEADLRPFDSSGRMENLFSDVQRYRLNQAAENPVLMQKYLRDTGQPPLNVSAFKSPWHAEAALQSRLQGDPAYREWASKYFDDALRSGDLKVSRGWSDTTGRERLTPFSLDNVVKAMKGRANSEGFDYGIGNLRAQITPQARNLKDIQDARGRIMPKDEWKPASEAVDNEIWAKALELRDAAKYPPRDKRDEMRFHSDASDAVRRSLISGDRELSYLFDPAKLPDMRAWRAETRDKIRGLGTDYFEAKPQRAVGLGEFEGAVVPKDVNPSVLDILRRNGIGRIETYDGGSRIPALSRFRDLAFGTAGATAAGAASGAFQTNDPKETY